MFESQKLLDQLNTEQRQAVLHGTGPAIVLAGAGSGKTRVLTTRVAYLLQENLATESEILLLTFTNKAAAEMKKRVLSYTNKHLLFSGTFHSLSAKILRIEASRAEKNGHILKINERTLSPNFTIYDSDDQLRLLKDIYKANGFDPKEFKPQAVKAVISNAKNELLGPLAYQEIANGNFNEKVAKIYKIYEQRLHRENALDFDDLLLLTYQLLSENVAVREHYQQQFKQVLIDEYQDTNRVQYLLTKIFAAPQNNLFVVGDFSQSIYAWRGADYKNLKRLSQDFPKIAEYRLERNYRSTQNILDAATQVIQKNRSHPILELWTDRQESDDEKIELYEVSNGELEAEKVAQIIARDFASNLSDIAVLYRTNAQSRAFEEAFIRHHLPYQIIGGTKFYERKEIKDLLAYLRLGFNDTDSPSLNRAIKLGKTRFKNFQHWLKSVTQEVLDNPLLALQSIIEITGYTAHYKPKDPEDQARLDNIEELLNVAGQFNDSLSFLENVALIQDDYLLDQKGDAQNSGITLMSLHSAKGLEFAIVFMVGMEEGLMPHARSMLDQQEIEEERRLCYVGITRAKRRLFFSYAQRRYTFGYGGDVLPSRFLSEIKPELLKVNRQFDLDDNPQAQHYYRQFKNKKKPAPANNKRRLVIDDDQLDALLNDELDIKEFLNS